MILVPFDLCDRRLIIPSSDAAFMPWLDELRKTVLRENPLMGIEVIPEDQYLLPRYQLAEIDAQHPQTNGYFGTKARSSHHLTGEFKKLYDTENSDPVPSFPVSKSLDPTLLDVTLRENRRLTPSTHWQDVRHLTLVAEDTVPYDPGDVLTVFPENLKSDVDSLIDLMHWIDVADKPLQYRSGDPNSAGTSSPLHMHRLTFSDPITLRELLTSQLDITAVPRRSFFSAIAHFAQDQVQKDRILDFVNPEYVDWLHDYTTRPRRSILEVLHELDSVKVPWKWALNIFPPLRGRQFSIASGGNLKTCQITGKSRFELLVAVVKYKTVIRKIRTGVCTRYLTQLPLGARLRVQLVKGSLGSRIQEHDVPVVMVGPGTGLAPLRSLIHERCSQAHIYEPEVADLALFFGCRSQSADYFYNEEWPDVQRHVPLKVYAAFSRDQKCKVYVQDLIRSESAVIYRLLRQQHGILVICGSSGSMPKAVRQAIVDAFTKAGNETPEAAEQYLQMMESQNRYKQETWS